MTKFTETHCRHGHEWTDENTYLYIDKRTGGVTRRKCRQCTLRRLGKKRALGRMRVAMNAPAPRTLRDDSIECLRVNRITHLQEELDRETRAWVREEIRAKIAELKDSKCD